MPLSGYFYRCFYIFSGSSGSDWFYVAEQEPVQLIANSNIALPNSTKNFLSHDLRQKIIKQVDHQFSDMSLVASDLFVKHINKHPKVYVSNNFVCENWYCYSYNICYCILKENKSLINSNHLLVQALQALAKLLTFSLTTVMDNVKTIRVCHPQECSALHSKNDVLISNKLHALMEYETIEQAEKAWVEKLDERNWRKSHRVRLLLRHLPRSVLKSRKSEYDQFERNSDEDDQAPSSESLKDSHLSNNVELSIEINRGWARGRGKSHGCTQGHNGCGLLSSPQSSSFIQGRPGFTIGRGKPVNTLIVPSLPVE
ncbi:hypothetical protein NE237_017409 [Protea cynaroides]|uniref:Uncharacterized protein n=1 Tax=Protea cynaroides TaxID=273540 RepID=A0A9Q0QMW2_9MAGN|nr:hypothetical protein NE237_017409 [Protea cynaroides]